MEHHSKHQHFHTSVHVSHLQSCFIRGSYEKITECNLMLAMFLSFAASSNPCSQPPRIENAVVKSSYQQKFLSGSVVTYQCRAEYTMDEGNTGTLECVNGEWENKSIICTCKYIEKLSESQTTFRNILVLKPNVPRCLFNILNVNKNV